MIKRITIEMIPHLDQRYNTVGDWQFKDTPDGSSVLEIKVSDLEDEKYFVLIALHEMIEALLCNARQIASAEVDKFDLEWQPRQVSWNSSSELAEPGEDYLAPYYEQHQIAVGIERIIASQMYVNWARYEEEVDQLTEVFKNHFSKQEEPAAKPVETTLIGKDEWDNDIPF